VTRSSATHTCVVGFDYQPKRGAPLRFEPTEPVAGLPAGVIAQLTKDGVIEAPNAGGDDA